MLGPPIVLYGVWRWYVLQEPAGSEQAFRSGYDWNFGALHETLCSIAGLIADAPLFHALMWLVTAVGLVSLFLTDTAREARWLAIICATVWIGYNLFLLLVYLGAMSPSDAEIAADYWRYTPHAALLGLYAPVMAIVITRWPVWMNALKLRAFVPTLAAVLLAFSALPVRSDINKPSGRDWQRFVRDAATQMRQIIPPGSKVLIVPWWDSSPFGVAVRYHLWQLGLSKRRTTATILWDERDLDKVEGWAKSRDVEYLVIQDIEGPMHEETSALGLAPLNHELALFAWQRRRWEKLKSWPASPDLVLRGSELVSHRARPHQSAASPFGLPVERLQLRRSLLFF
jgi:hypothetical protein